MDSTSIRWHLAPGLAAPPNLTPMQVLKQASHRRLGRVVGDGIDVHVKVYREGVLRWLRGWRARREYDITRAVAARDVPTLEALAWGEDGRSSYLVTRTLPEAVSLLDVLQSPLTPALRQTLAQELGAFLARAHRAGVRHHDLHPGNLLVQQVGEQVSLFLIDLDGVKLSGPLSWRSARDNLIVLDRWFSLRFSRADRFRGWLAYCREASLADDRVCVRELEQRSKHSLSQFLTRLDRRCQGGNRHFRRVRNGVAVAEVDASSLNIDLFDDPAARVLKRSKSSAVIEAEVTLAGKPTLAIFKRVDATKWLDPWLSLFRPPPALHAYRVGHALRLRGLPTPRPLAVWHRKAFGLPTHGYVVFEKVPEARDLLRFLDSLAEDETQRRDALLVQLGRLIRRLHEWNLSHRDLKSANVLVSPQGSTMGPRGLEAAAPVGGDHVWLVDLAGVRLHGKLSERIRIRDLARLNVSFASHPRVSRTMRLRLLRAYLRGRADWKDWWRRIEQATWAKIERNRRRARPVG